MCWGTNWVEDFSPYNTANNTSAVLGEVAYPFEFIETPMSQVVVHAIGMFSWSGYTCGDTTTFKAVGYYQGSPSALNWHMLAFGKWK